jgi:lactocepin
MRKSKLKAVKVMTTVAVTSLILSSFTVFAETNNTSTATTDEAALQAFFKQASEKSWLKDQQIDQEQGIVDQAHKAVDDQYAPNDSVRVIVELTEEPVSSAKGHESEKKKLKQAHQSLIKEMKESKK